MYGSRALCLLGSFKKRGSFHPVYHEGMTALVSQFTSDGFVVGADSLRCDMYGKVVTENAVKLYATNCPSFVGAFGFVGHTAIEYVGQRPMLNILEVANHVADDLAHVPCDGPKEYVEDFCQDLANRIAVESIGIILPSHSEFMRVMFVGYHRQRPFRLQVVFPTINGALQVPRLTEMVEAPDRFCIASGSQVVWDELSQELTRPETLQDATDFVRAYITRCIENTTDPYCSTIGGHPQIATVTPEGFNWVARP
jgi:hypothetical protein